MRTDRAIARLNSERIANRPSVDRQTNVKTLPSLAVGNKGMHAFHIHTLQYTQMYIQMDTLF